MPAFSLVIKTFFTHKRFQIVGFFLFCFLSKGLLLQQIMNARWKTDFMQAILQAKGSKLEKCVYWLV